MTISLTSDQQAWISTQVARGEFASLADAVRQLIDERIAERLIEEEDDLAWAKPFVDDAMAEIGNSEVMTLEEHEARMDAVLASTREYWRGWSSRHRHRLIRHRY